MKFCQSCGMPLTKEILGTNADGSKNEDYCIYCYKDGKFQQECTMEEMIEHCAQFVDEVNKGLPQPITKEEYIGRMKMYFPRLKCGKSCVFSSRAANERRIINSFFMRYSITKLRG